MIKEIIATTTLITLNNFGLFLVINTKGFLKIAGYFDYIVTTLFCYFIITKYMETDFYKNLGQEKLKGVEDGLKTNSR